MWGKRADWHDYSGTVDGKTGRHRLVRSSEERAPGRLAHAGVWTDGGESVRPGLVSRTPRGELAKLAKGEHLKLRYGLLLHKGDAKDGKVAEHYAAFAKE